MVVFSNFLTSYLDEVDFKLVRAAAGRVYGVDEGRHALGASQLQERADFAGREPDEVEGASTAADCDVIHLEETPILNLTIVNNNIFIIIVHYLAASKRGQSNIAFPENSK